MSPRRPLLRPWGFAPVNGRDTPVTLVEEEYSTALAPLYSTLPDSTSDMVAPWSAGHARLAYRTNQHIIMMNPGPNGKGFKVCRDCGAAAPDTSDEPLKSISQPYPKHGKFSKETCPHRDVAHVDLGFEFLTDMFVIEIELPSDIIDTALNNNYWIPRAGQTLAEAIKLATSKLLDVDITELVAGYRKRMAANSAFIDVYVYDSLSSGAGYAVSLQPIIDKLFKETETILNNCQCQTACHNCLQHFRNQYVQGTLDRFSGLDLLHWARDGKIAPEKTVDEQWTLLTRIADILTTLGIKLERCKDSTGEKIQASLADREKTIVVYPAMWTTPKPKLGRIFINEAFLRFARPLAVQTIMDEL